MRWTLGTWAAALLIPALVVLAGVGASYLPDPPQREFPPYSTLIFRSGSTTVCQRGVTMSPWDSSYTCHQDDGDFTVAHHDVSAVKVPR